MNERSAVASAYELHSARPAIHTTAGVLERAGALTLHYGLILVLAWIGAMKFTPYEAHGIQPLVATSPLLAWLYGIASTRAVSNLLGVAELSTAALLALRGVSPLAAVVGGGLAAATFATTLTFLFSAPGWERSLGGFPALSAMPGQFLLKDVVLLGAALRSMGEAARRA